MKNKSKSSLLIRKICVTAMLTALSVVIGIVCKNYFTWLVYYRVTFENMPLIIVGYCFGPFWGCAAAVIADLISCLCSTNPAVNPIITCGAAMVGIMSGVAPMIYCKIKIHPSKNTARALSVAAAHLFGQVIVKSIGKIVFFAMPWYGIFIGFGISCIVGAAEYYLIKLLLENREINRIMGELAGYEFI